MNKKNKRLYLESGYLDFRYILSLGLTFNFIVGARGVGKTYGALKTVVEDKTKFMLMRRQQSQTDIINKADFSPFKTLNRDNGWTITPKSISKYSAGFYDSVEEDGKIQTVGSAYGYTCALSTISNMRGFDASDIDVIIWDEFIPERHERPIKNESDAFFNAYETLNRNRELNGGNPIQLLALANANDLANPMFISLGLVRKAEQMKKKGQEISLDYERGIGLFILQDSPISNKKKTTALYRLVNGGSFKEMALNNSFVDLDDTNVKSCPLIEYKPVVSVGELTIYEHKSKHNLYVSTHMSGSVDYYRIDSEVEKARFCKNYLWVWLSVIDNNVIFEEYLCLALLTKYYK